MTVDQLEAANIVQEAYQINAFEQPQQQQNLVSFRKMTNRAGAESQSSSHADRVAAALVMSGGPESFDM